MFFLLQSLYSDCFPVCRVWNWYIYQSSQGTNCGEASPQSKLAMLVLSFYPPKFFLDGIPVHHRLISYSMSPVTNYTSGLACALAGLCSLKQGMERAYENKNCALRALCCALVSFARTLNFR